MPDIAQNLITNRNQTLFYINKKIYELNFLEFLKEAWGQIDPTPYKDNWHMHAIADYLTHFRNREILNLIINIPPGFAKSMSCSVIFPAWIWTTDAPHGFLTGSHALEFSIRDTRKSRALIESDWYQRRWGLSIMDDSGNRFGLIGDQNVKSNYVNDKGGHRIAVSVGSGTTGHRGNTLIFDDPISFSQASSTTKTELNKANDYLSQAFSTRGNIVGAPVGILMIGQRLCKGDPTDFLMSMGTFEHLVLPMEFEPQNKFVGKYFTDPRNQDKESLWPEVFTPEKIEIYKRLLGKQGTAAQLQQRPTVEEGNIIKREYLKFYKKSDLPSPLTIIQSSDTAFKTGTMNDYSVCVTIGKFGDKFYLIDMTRGKYEFPELKKLEFRNFEKHNPMRKYIEDAASGQSLIQEFRSLYKGIADTRIKPIKADKDKVSGVNAITPILEAGNFFLPEDESFTQTIIDEMLDFPNGEHDDIVDAIRIALNAERQIMAPRITSFRF